MSRQMPEVRPEKSQKRRSIGLLDEGSRLVSRLAGKQLIISEQFDNRLAIADL